MSRQGRAALVKRAKILRGRPTETTLSMWWLNREIERACLRILVGTVSLRPPYTAFLPSVVRSIEFIVNVSDGYRPHAHEGENTA